ncbi:acyl-CoA dehydrogenase [Steroidobacter agaridevorans]|uniref:Acyl-CoA dehydrogenase n=1 Tax=Steroidobacter agaridevorans TaxID=2695856 RepID=A0A829YFJ6_9GAMM|nr:acyl-CoA dehydrogenase family protein [Steroidobacter agaridevorans]GFE82069.1 acyl-CoA dehydrogenase [Steroidobacter agaridevorans]GFE85543.1 acyl-CoA dehydrogenase [Steroidobacter agaridevorans]
MTDEAGNELREAIRPVLEGKWDGTVAHFKEGRTAQAEDELWNEAASLGWFGVAIAEEHGGLGLGYAGLAVLYEELGRYLAPLPALPMLLAAEAIALAGDDAQKSMWLPKIAAGEIRISMALPLKGEPLPRVTAEGVVSGRVPHVGCGSKVDYLLLPVRSERGVDLAIFDVSAKGVVVTPAPIIDLTRSMCTVTLEGVQTDGARRLLLTAEQWERLLDHASVALALDSVGGGMHILERTVAYMSVRTQFGRPIGSFQALKHRAASWKVWLEGARALTTQAALQVASSAANASSLASSAKASACDVYTGVAGDAIQLHGGIGFTWEHECHLFMKRARLNAAWLGTPLQHRERVAGLSFAAALGPDFSRGGLLAIS